MFRFLVRCWDAIDTYHREYPGELAETESATYNIALSTTGHVVTPHDAGKSVVAVVQDVNKFDPFWLVSRDNLQIINININIPF